MATQTQNQAAEQEQEKKDNVRFQELNKKAERNEEENKELGELKDRYGKRMGKRIDKLTYERETEREEKEKAEKDLEDANKRIVELEKPPQEELPLDETTIEVGGKKYYTDTALRSRVEAGKITEQDAWDYAATRNKEDTIATFEKRQIEKDKKRDDTNARTEDAEKVLKAYPHFDKKHKDFNLEEPLYKLTTQLYSEGLVSNPKGLSIAVKRAKQILRIKDTNIDRSSDLNLDTSELHPNTPPGEKEVILSEYEKEAAERMFCRGDMLNPKTGRAYTEDEAHAKALQAKKGRK